AKLCHRQLAKLRHAGSLDSEFVGGERLFNYFLVVDRFAVCPCVECSAQQFLYLTPGSRSATVLGNRLRRGRDTHIAADVAEQSRRKVHPLRIRNVRKLRLGVAGKGLCEQLDDILTLGTAVAGRQSGMLRQQRIKLGTGLLCSGLLSHRTYLFCWFQEQE